MNWEGTQEGSRFCINRFARALFGFCFPIPIFSRWGIPRTQIWLNLRFCPLPFIRPLDNGLRSNLDSNIPGKRLLVHAPIRFPHASCVYAIFLEKLQLQWIRCLCDANDTRKRQFCYIKITARIQVDGGGGIENCLAYRHVLLHLTIVVSWVSIVNSSQWQKRDIHLGILIPTEIISIGKHEYSVLKRLLYGSCLKSREGCQSLPGLFIA